MKRRAVFFILITLFAVYLCIGCNMLNRTDENSANAADSPFMPISYESYVKSANHKYFMQIVHAETGKSVDVSEYCKIIDTVIDDAQMQYAPVGKELVATVYKHQFTSDACAVSTVEVYKDSASGELFVSAQAPESCGLKHGEQGVIELRD